jgi:large conductance mechanosensitive channel
MIEEFKKFALKGNVLDLAVATIIGGAFNKIVGGFTTNVIMPIVGLLMPGESSWREFGIALGKKIKNDKGEMVDAKLAVGELAGNILDFLIIALVLFMIVKAATKAMAKKEEAPAAPPAQEVLLGEIRDLLKKANS